MAATAPARIFGIRPFVLLIPGSRSSTQPIGLRVTSEQEEEGLDIALHDERGYIL